MQYLYPGQIIQGPSRIQVSDVFDLSLLVAFECRSAHFFSGLVLSCPSFPAVVHTYGRLVDEVTLRETAEPRATASPNSRSNGKLGTGSIFDQDGVSHETTWTHMLLYCVKEGVLVFFCSSSGECKDVLRSIATSFADHPESKVACVEHTLGRAPHGIVRLLVEAIAADLDRSFAIRCDPGEQNLWTNCAAFCVRVISACTFALRGYDLCKVCQNHKDIGPIAGDAVSGAWERLMRLAK